MKIKCFVLSTICILVSFLSYGQEPIKCLVLLKNDQSTVYFPLSEEPKITFSLSENAQFLHGAMMVMAATEELIVETKDNNKMEIVDYEPTGLGSLLTPDSIKIADNDIIVETSVPELSFSIVDTNGIVVKRGILSLGLSSISLSSLSPGTYIVSIASQSIKVNVR